jgi:uncharacterized repeat protein (TIGR03803 family)
MDAKGNLYGTTTSGGASGYYGTVFKVSATGEETVLHNFTNGPTDGAYPEGGLVLDAEGNLYGTTTSGGSSGGGGTVFKIDKKGDESLLYSFTGSADGGGPDASLIQDDRGNLYGTTNAGGDMQCGNGCGVVFKLDKAGHETVLHTFSGPDGAVPNYTTLLMDAKGNLYGDTLVGGASNMGVVYKLSRSGKLSVLHSFAGGEKDGCYPWGALVSDATGNLYGTTQVCGAFDGGTVYKLSTSGKLTLLHSFAGFGGSRGGPVAGVIRDADGNLYGDTVEGGSTRCGGYGCGTVYKLTKTGTITILHSFSKSNGEYPYSGLMRDAKGNLYGTTTEMGGSTGYGTAWRLTP